MHSLLVIRSSAPGREEKLEIAQRWFSAAKAGKPDVLPKLRTMVAAMKSTTATLAVIVEPKDTQKLAERLRQAAEAKRQANAAIRATREGSGGGLVAGKVRPVCDPLVSATFIVVARKKVPQKDLPGGVKSFSLDEADAIVRAIGDAAALAAKP